MTIMQKKNKDNCEYLIYFYIFSTFLIIKKPPTKPFTIFCCIKKVDNIKTMELIKSKLNIPLYISRDK